MKVFKSVLLIDDDEEDYYLFKQAIKQCCNDVTTLIYERDSRVAMTLLTEKKDFSPDIIFLDWYMPNYSGEDFLTTIRKLPLYSDVPVVIFTGAAPNAFKKNAKKLGATLFLCKPDSFSELVKNLKLIFSYEWKYFDNFNI